MNGWNVRPNDDRRSTGQLIENALHTAPQITAALFQDGNVRLRCARGLEALKRRDSRLVADHERLLQQATRTVHELRTSPAPVDLVKDYHLEFLFLLLGAVYEPEPVALCLQALHGEDRALQGTALEYLENLLPSRIWEDLQPLIAPGFSAPRKQRTLQQAGSALLAAAAKRRSQRNGDRRPATSRSAVQSSLYPDDTTQ